MVGVPKPDEIMQLNQSAFNSLMTDFSKPAQDWVIKYVAAMGIPLTSPHWLPAALSARLILEMRQSGRNATIAFNGVAEKLGERQTKIEERTTALERLVVMAEQNIAGNIRESIDDVKIAIKTTGQETAEHIAAPLQQSGQNLAETVVKAIREVAQSAASAAAKDASTNIALQTKVFLRNVTIGLLAALLIGAFGGWFGTHWYDTAHAMPKQQSSPKKHALSKKHGSLKQHAPARSR